jgi:hypothetical protein
MDRGRLRGLLTLGGVEVSSSSQVNARQVSRPNGLLDELRDGGHLYLVERVEQPAHEHALGRGWVRLVKS